MNHAKLASAVLALLISPLMMAQTGETNVSGGDLNEVEIFGNRTPVSYQQSTRVVSVISKQDLAQLSVQSVNDVLDYVSGVDLRQRGPVGIQSDVSIRGGSFDQVMVLLNGINVTDPQTGHFSMNLPVDISAIERIEILEGPGARAFGPNAFSGAINFVTGTSDNNNLKADVSGGQYGLINAGASTTIHHKNLQSFVSARGVKSDGYAENTDFQSTNIFYQGKLALGKDKLDWQMGYLDKSFGAFAFYTPKYPNQYEQNRTLFSSLKYTSSGKIKLTPSVYWRRNHDRFELFRNNPATWYTTHNYHLTDVMGASVNGSTTWTMGTTSLGGEVRGESIWSNNLGDLLTTPIDVPGEEGAQFNRSYSRVNSSLFVEHTYTLNGLIISAGLLANHNTGLDYRIRFFPGIDVAYWLNNQLKLTAGYNRSLRMPTFTDLFSNTSTTMGNRQLKPEEVDATEVSIRWTKPGIESRISGIYRKAQHLIDWGKIPTEVKYQSLNISEMETNGVQFFTAIKPTDWWGNTTFVKKLSFDYLYLNQNKEADTNYDSRYVMDYLKHKVVFAFTHRLINSLTVSWNVSWQERMGTYSDQNSETQSYDPFWLTDVRVNWHTRNIDIYAEASNLFEASFQDIGSIPQPGRWLRGGVKYNLEW
jgi:iron complex outermembrane receptor protein